MRASRDRKGGWNDDDDDFVSRSANPNAPPPADDDDDDDFAQLRKEKKEAPKSDGTRHTERRRMNLKIHPSAGSMRWPTHVSFPPPHLVPAPSCQRA
jgi:hypothetical protein